MGRGDRKGRDGINPPSTPRRFNTPRISPCRSVDEAACPLATLAVVLPTAPLTRLSLRQWGKPQPYISYGFTWGCEQKLPGVSLAAVVVLAILVWLLYVVADLVVVYSRTLLHRAVTSRLLA